jgi:hypothetical protein
MSGGEQIRLTLPRQNSHDRILAQMIVIVEILIAQRETKDPLLDQCRHIMLDQVSAAMIPEAFRKSVNQPDPSPLTGARPHPRSPRRHQSRPQLYAFPLWKSRTNRGCTLYASGLPFALRFDSVAKRNSQSSRPDAPPTFEISGSATISSGL